MDRRNFVKQVLLYSAGLTFSVPTLNIAQELRPVKKRVKLAHLNGHDYNRITKEAVELIGGLKPFIKSGDRVVIKPNIGWDRSPEQGANTHPEVVRALVELALDAGAGKVQVFDYTCNEKRRCYQNSGIKDALKPMGRKVRLEHIDRRKFIPVDISKGQSLTRWDIYRDALTADCYINVPVAKHHGLSGLSLGLKNSMGVIGGNRGRLHHDLGQKLADLATVVAPQITVIDATRILLRNGPQGGSLKDVRILDTVIGSTDPVAADAYATTLFGMKPETLGSTRAAYEMGLGQMHIDQMEVIKKVV